MSRMDDGCEDIIINIIITIYSQFIFAHLESLAFPLMGFCQFSAGGGELSRGTPATGANSVPGPARPQVFGGHENPWNRHEKNSKNPHGCW